MGAGASAAAGLPSYVQDLGHGVYAIDTGFQRDHFDAAYLVVEAGRAAFVDTGTNFAVPRLIQALASLGLAPEAVDWVIPTHVHLDHAGGVGLLMQSLPSARVMVHPRGLRHLADPSALYQGALAVYGQAEMDRSYGALVPVAADRLQASEDGLVVELAGRPLRLIDTPGHARHHHCVWDERSRGWFTGDTFGLSYRELDHEGRPWVLPTTTPVQFEPDPLHRSLDRLMEADPQCMYLTHYGRIGDVRAAAEGLHRLIDALVTGARALRDVPRRHDALKAMQLDLYTASLQSHGLELTRDEVADCLALDLELNAQGLAVWLDR